MFVDKIISDNLSGVDFLATNSLKHETTVHEEIQEGYRVGTLGVQPKATKTSNNPTKKARITKVDATNKKTPINQEKPNPPAIKKAVTNVFEAKKKTPYKPSTNG